MNDDQVNRKRLDYLKKAHPNHTPKYWKDLQEESRQFWRDWANPKPPQEMLKEMKQSNAEDKE